MSAVIYDPLLDNAVNAGVMGALTAEDAEEARRAKRTFDAQCEKIQQGLGVSPLTFPGTIPYEGKVLISPAPTPALRADAHFAEWRQDAAATAAGHAADLFNVGLKKEALQALAIAARLGGGK